mgnify:FL=1
MKPIECNFKAHDKVTGTYAEYRVEKRLGEGGFGVVYKVLSEKDGQPYALKVLKLWTLSTNDQDNYRKRFHRAYTVMHDQCCHLLYASDYGEVDGNPFYVMEYCPGGDLTDYLAKKSAATRETEIVRCMYQALLGLYELHSKGLVHRDIKPENVMLRPDGSVALNDFDLAGDENNRFTTQYFMGIPKQSFYTKAYAPPEQVNPIRGKKEVMVMPTIDMFAYAVMVYQLLTGRFPFGSIRTESDMAVYYVHASNNEWDRDALRTLKYADFWQDIIEPCLKGDYKQRLGDASKIITLFESTFPYLRESASKSPRPQKAALGRYALEIVYGEDVGATIILNTAKPILTMGRQTSTNHNDIALNDDTNRYVSRRHATLEWDGAECCWYLRDGQFDFADRCWKPSKNGTHVNSCEVDAMAGIPLMLGDIIYVGEVRLKVVDAAQ